ncbi:MAG TPA: LptE family protein [candidate division Zixibacteria bacterium]
MSRTTALCSCVAATGLMALGCAPYSFTGGRTALVNSVHVSVFENETPEFGIEEALTKGIIEGFLDDNQIRVVEPTAAEAILSGRVVQYERRAYTFDETDRVTEYIVEIWVTANLAKQGSGGPESIWSIERQRGFGIYNADNEDEQAGQQRAIDKIGEDLLNRTIKSW